MTEATPPSEPLQKLPVFAVVGAAYGSFFRYLRYLPQAALLPVLLGAPLYWAYWKILQQVTLDPAGSGALGLLLLPLYVLLFFAFVIFCVAWYRLNLLGADRGRPPLFPVPKRRHWLFLGYSLLILVVYLAIVLFFGVLPLAALAPLIGQDAATLNPAAALGIGLLVPLWGLALFCLVVFVVLRLSFVFPAASVDEDYALHNAWAHTKGQVLRFFAALFLVSVPPVLGIMIFSLATPPELTGPQGDPAATDPAQIIAQMEDGLLYFVFVGYLLGLCYWAIVIGAVVAAFKGLTGWYPEPNPATPAVSLGS